MNTELSTQAVEGKHSFVEKAVRLFPLIFILTILPLIVRVYPYYANLSQYQWFSTDDFQVDFFLHGKRVALNVIGIYMLILLAAYTFMGKVEKRTPWILIPIGIYAVFAFASSIVSPYSQYAFNGNFEGFESVWTVLVYCLIVIYAFYMVRSAEDVRVLLYSFSVGVLILTVIGILQSTGNNPLSVPWVTRLTIPSQYREALEGVLEYNSGTYITLYNINYTGVYMAMTAPVIAFLIFDFDKNKDFSSIKSTIFTIIKIFFFFILTVTVFYTLYLSESEAGILALCAGIVFIPIIMYRKIWQHKLVSVGVLAVVIVAVITGKSYIQPAFERLAEQLFTEKQSNDLTRIHADETGVTFTYKGADITFKMEEMDTDYYVFRAYDGNGQPINTAGNTWVYAFEDEPYSDFSVSYYPINDYLSMSIWLGDNNWVFTNTTGTGTYQMLNYYEKWIDLADPEIFAPLEGFEHIFSNRGYIWSRSIPLLKQSVVLGVGADCFIFAFPQLDYWGRANSGYTDNQIFTKPHNLYLQIAIQYGIPALLAFLIFFGMYFVQGFQIYSKNKMDCFEVKIGFGIFIAMIVYMITGLTNDSMIVVSPLFWCLMGIGIVVNDIVIFKNKNIAE